ncbi:MAG: DNA-directed RNA polymerase subunit N [Candidatus Undinarchaeales archaeon]|jgi:DNA-directed RNA polymerase subunit N|nr:DNA-directed RNA polymerase subunit N [Candidatus Undinarchaeales archaeon]
MIIPVRCFSCGKVLGAEYEDYKRRIADGEEPSTVLNELGVERYCCRRMLLSQVDLVDDIAQFEA